MSGTSDRPRAAGLWRHGDFLKLWSAQTVSLVGTQVSALALPLTAILKLNATPFEVGLLGSLQYLPFLLVTLPAGAIVDRLRRRPVLVAADLARALILLGVPVAVWLGHLSMGLLYPVAFLVGMLSVFFDVAHQSYLPALVEPGQLVEGNTKLQLSYSGAQLAGPGIGGVLVQLLTAPIAILADAASYVGSALLLVSIRRPEPQEPRPDAGGGLRADLRGLGQDIREGTAFVWRHALIRPLALATGTANFFYLFGMTGAVLTLYAVRVLHLSPAQLGLVLAVGNVGAILGSLAADRVLERWRFGLVMIVCSVVSAVAISMMALATRGTALPVLAAAVLVGETGIVVYDIAQISLRQAATPPRLLGRMNATVRFVNWGPIPVGALVGGTLGQTIGLRPTLWVAAAGSVLPAVPLLLSQIRGLRRLPEPVEPLEPSASDTDESPVAETVEPDGPAVSAVSGERPSPATDRGAG